MTIDAGVKLDIQESPAGVSVKVRVQPRSSRTAVQGVYEGALKISLTTPPVEGQANAACAVFLADTFGLAKSQVTLTGGQKNRNKIFLLRGMTAARFEGVLKKILSSV